MDLLIVKHVAELLMRLSGQKEAVAVLPMRVQKANFSSPPESTQPFPRAAPESVGIKSAYLGAFLTRAADDREGNLHSITVLRHGKVIAACGFPPFDRTVWHVTHSLCKTITGLAAGILMDDGRLSVQERVIDIFPEKASPISRMRWRSLTIGHLLAMTSGSPFNELASVTQTDWVRGFLDAAPQFEPGTDFQYNSMNTYMLAAIVCAKTGRTLTEFLNERLFGPMGIRKYHWETCPLGIEKGGWGLYIQQEDMAKLGQLVLDRGMWQGKQLVSKSYIRDMCAKQSSPPAEMSDYGYGYQCWLWARKGSILFNGLFGQNILVLPDLDMVIVSSAGGDRMFGKSVFLDLCAEYFGSKAAFPDTLPPDNRAFRHFQRTVRRLTDPRRRGEDRPKGLYGMLDRYQLRRFRDAQNAWADGKSYTVGSGTARLLPLFVQVLENNYTTGMSRIKFICKDKSLYIDFEEGKERNTLKVGFSEPERGVLRANGEEQLVAVSGKWTQNEDNVPVLKLELALLEQSSTRYIKLFFEEDGILRLKFSERPSRRALEDGAAFVLGASRMFGALSGAVPQERLRTRFDALAEPELTAKIEQ